MFTSTLGFPTSPLNGPVRFCAALKAERSPQTRRVNPIPPSPPPPQAVTIITYKEPENPEYRPFVERLKEEALTHFNFTMRDGLVRSGDSGTGRGHGVGPGASVG